MGSAFGFVPPEVPESRTSRSYTPFTFVFGDAGESVLQSGGPNELGYWNTLSFVGGGPPTQNAPVGDVGVFIQRMLRSPIGITLIASHGSHDHAVVEVHNTQEAAVAALNGYIQSGVLAANEAMLAQTPEDYWGIAAKGQLFQAHLEGKDKHSIMILLSCYSADLSWWFTGAQKVRNFVGVDHETGLSYGDGLLITGTILEHMAGRRNDDNGPFTNHTIDNAVTLTNDALLEKYGSLFPKKAILSESYDPTQPPAREMRLYNAPRIVMADIKYDQDSDGTYEKQVYRFVMGSDLYPYNPGNKTDYPTQPSEPLIRVPISPGGRLQIALRFSEPMYRTAPDFDIHLARPSGASDVPVEGGWDLSKTNMEDKTLGDYWSGTALLPADTQDGDVVLHVRARHTVVPPQDADIYNQYLDMTGSGASMPGAYDTQISIPIADPYFLVEREKLTFSGLAQKTRKNSGARSFTIGA
jgi:hypothetical protein